MTESGVKAGPLAGRVAIVTGGGKGLGRAFALHLAASGAAVVVNNRRRVTDNDGRWPADVVVGGILATGGTAVAEYSDVADPDSGRAMVDLAIERFGRIDFLVTSAGIGPREMFHKSSPERFDEALATNVSGTVYVTLACCAAMRDAGFGRIVLVSSGAGLHGEPTAAAYSASKGAIIALARAIAGEGQRRNVLTNVLLPYADTQMTAGMHDSLRRLMIPEAVAPVVTALVDPDCTLNGQILVSCAGGLRSAGTVEYGSVRLPSGPLTPAALAELVDESRRAPAREYTDAMSAFLDLAGDLTRSG